MKFGISNIAWNKLDDDYFIEHLYNNNIKFLEVAPTKISENPYDNYEQFSNYLKKLNGKLEVISIQSIAYGINYNLFRNFEENKLFFEHIMKVLKFADNFKIPNIVFGCPKNRNIENPANIELGINFFKSLDKELDKFNTTLSLEPNPEIYGTNFLNNTFQVIDFINYNELNNIKLNFDFGSFELNKEKFDSIDNYINLINHVHISKPNLEYTDNYERIDLLLQKLNELNYSKTISFEIKEHPKFKVEEIIKLITKYENI